MEKIRATVGILTLKSGATLERALESVAMFDDILVSDGGSTDATVAIAKRCGARVIAQLHQGPIADFSLERNHLLRNARHDWFLALDADETASLELVEEIRTIVETDQSPFVYRVLMGLMYEGRDVLWFSSLPGEQTRFFSRKSCAAYVKPVHERISFPLQEIGTLRGKWYIHWGREHLAFSFFREHLASDARLGADQPFLSFLRWKIIRNLLGAVYILAYMLRVRLTHPWDECAPIKLEMNKIGYKLLHILYAMRFRYGK